MFSTQQDQVKVWLVEGITLLFILLFFYAGLSQLIDGNKFYDNVNNSPILGGSTIASIAEWMVPMSELMVAFLLTWRKTRLKGMFAVLGLLFIFTGYIIGILFYSPYIPCSCGGVIALLSWKQHLLFNTLCIGLAALNIALLKRKKKGFKKGINNISTTHQPKKSF